MSGVTQDWAPVVLVKRGAGGGGGGGGGGGPRAAPGEKKEFFSSNKGVHSTVVAGAGAKKLEEDTETFGTPGAVGLDVGKAIQQARCAKVPPMTQKDLAARVNEKPSVIQEWEQGKAVPNGAFLAKLETALGVRLPRPPKKK